MHEQIITKKDKTIYLTMFLATSCVIVKKKGNLNKLEEWLCNLSSVNLIECYVTPKK